MMKNTAAKALILGVLALVSSGQKKQDVQENPVQQVVQIVKKRANECYDAQYAYWTRLKTTIDCDSAVKSMFQEIDATARIGFSGSFEDNSSLLKNYMKRHGYFFLTEQARFREQQGYDFLLSRVTKEGKEKMEMEEGKKEMTVVHLEKPEVAYFFEERLSTPEVTFVGPELVDGGKVYLRTDDAAAYAAYLWEFYKTQNYDAVMGDSRMGVYLAAGDLQSFYREVGMRLTLHEWKDLYDSAASREAFIRAFVDTQARLRTYHGARHVMDRKAYSQEESEARAKLEELLALKSLPAAYKVQGYDVLGDAAKWLTMPSEQHKQAGKAFLDCAISVIYSNRFHFPNIEYPKNEAGGSIMRQFTSLTGKQIGDIGDACYKASRQKQNVK